MSESNKNHLKFTKKFKDAYQSLNAQQKEAVDTIDGPVMVVAGPGTGKTQILALRIGNILLKTDTQPQNILCLTYTDAGAIAMRKRLLQFIGTDAYRIQVHTYHSFCNQIIQDNQEVFSEYSTLMHISDLEKAKMYRDLIDRLPYENPLRKLRGQHYFEAKRLDRLYSTIKKEFWTSEMILDSIVREIEKIDSDKNDGNYFYKINGKNFRAGDPKKKYYDTMRNLELLREAVLLFEPFQQEMKDAGRYDFDDMIHWVVKAFKDDDLLLASYQEKFLYLLVDEYQDTNGSQNEIIRLLSDYWEKPNLFVVGDEDQAIFRFQGANITNLKNLRDLYNPRMIVLTENYRSTQPILDAAMRLIQYNEERLSGDIPEIEKNLKAQPGKKAGASAPKVYEYLNVAQEETAVFESLKELHERGEPLHEIAVIYRKHAQATNLIKALAYHGIPVDVKHRVNILDDPLIHNLESILTLLHEEYLQPGSNDRLLFKIMHYRFFQMAPVDLARLAQYCWREPRAPISLRQTIKDNQLLDTLNLSNSYTILAFSDMLDRWIQRIPHVTLQVLFEYILKEGNIFGDIMSGELRTYRMQVVATFFNYLKAESHRNPAIDLGDFLDTLTQMREIGLSLPMHSLTRNKDGINFLTAHGAKGLEFKHVFIIGCNRRNWEKSWGGNHGFSLPSNLQDPSQDSDERDERRLFYVAMTRAKERLTLSFAAENLNGMPDEHSQFINECMQGETDFKEVQVLPDKTVQFYYSLLDSRDSELPLLDHELIDKKLEKLVLSPTSLNQFLACPRSFYFESILGVPLSNNQYLGFGNAVHDALHLFLNKLKNGLEANPETIKELFEISIQKFRSFFTPKQFENYLAHGLDILPRYVEDKLPLWREADMLLAEKGIDHVIHKDVPITGRLDLMLRGKDGRLRVIDFKTGNVDNTVQLNKKLKPAKDYSDIGGDYWRQVVFYQILLAERKDANGHMDEGIMSFVEYDKYGQFVDRQFLVNYGEVEIVSDQLVDSYQKMKNHEFDVDCNRPECTWCSFIKNDYVLPAESIRESEEENEDRYLSFGEDTIQLHFDF